MTKRGDNGKKPNDRTKEIALSREAQGEDLELLTAERLRAG